MYILVICIYIYTHVTYIYMLQTYIYNMHIHMHARQDFIQDERGLYMSVLGTPTTACFVNTAMDATDGGA